MRILSYLVLAKYVYSVQNYNFSGNWNAFSHISCIKTEIIVRNKKLTQIH